MFSKLFETAFKESIPLFEGKRLLLLKETTLPQLAIDAISSLTNKHLSIRYQNAYTYSVYSAKFIGKDLFVTFSIMSTFRDGQSLYAGYTESDNNHYSVVIEFLDAAKFFQNINSLDKNAKKQAVQQIISSCNVKLYSDDPSFYYQGFWEDLAKVNMSIYPFPGPSGTGKWQSIHFASGGLANPKVRVTKHIAQLAKEINYYIDYIVQKI